MSRKNILIIIVVIFFIGISYLVYQLILQKSSTIKTDQKFISDPKNAAYTIENQNVSLIDGRSEKQILSDSMSKIITQYFGNEARGDFNNDGIGDTAFLLTQSSGGSGIFYYVVVLLSQEGNYVGTNAIFLWDRIAPNTTEFQNGKIIVNYADRKSDETMHIAPSVGVSRYFKILDSRLVEIQTWTD